MSMCYVGNQDRAHNSTNFLNILGPKNNKKQIKIKIKIE